MKPILIYVHEDGDKITLEKSEFEKMLLNAYESGMEDGKATINPLTYPGISQPYATWANEHPLTTQTLNG